MSDQDKASRDMLRGMLARSLDVTNTPEFGNIILPELRNMFEENKTNYKEMCDLQAKFIATAKVGVAKQNAKLWIEAVEKDYRELRQKLSARIYQLERANNAGENLAPRAIHQLPMSTRSPEGLGEFDGTHANWPQFRDLFIALVGSQDYPNLNKLLYLKKSCTGPAALAIRGYEPIQDCYEADWNALNAIYEDDYAVTQALIDRLVNMPLAKDAGVKELRRIIDTTTSTLRQLSGLQEETEKWDSVVINLITKKLPFTIIESWEQLRKRNQRPTLSEFLEFLDARARARMFNATPTPISAPRHDKERNYGLERNTRRQNATTGYKNSRTTWNVQAHRTNEGSQGCRLCDKNHNLANCSVLLGKHVSERRRILVQLGVCLNCLNFGHYLNQCNRPSCSRRECKNDKHHWTLCSNASSPKLETKLQVGATVNKRKRKD